MWEEVNELPNEPGKMVSVTWTREMVMRFGQHAGKVVNIPMALIGSSAREITTEEKADGKGDGNPVGIDVVTRWS